MKKSSFRLQLAAVAAAALAWVSAAQANVVTITGALSTTDPVFNRPTTLTTLSGVGTAVYYDVYAFTVSAVTTDFSFATTSAAFSTGTANDTFICLYGGSFSGAAPLSNLLALNDDANGVGLSLLTYSPLNPGTTYYALITSYSNGQTGPYAATLTSATSTITLSAVPEPSTYALLGAGVVGVAALAVRRRKLTA